MGIEKKTDRKVKNQKETIFDTYVNILMLMIENKDKSFMNSEIREKLFDNPTEKSIKSMVKRVVDFYVGSGIFTKVTETTDTDGNIIELKPTQYGVRLYDKDIDGVDENGNYYDDYYVVDLHIPNNRDGRERLCETVSSMITTIPNVDIYTPTLKTVLESQLFGFQTHFVSQTISKTTLKHHNINNESTSNDISGYPLDVISSIINSQINVNVTFENFENTIELKNTKIKRVSIKENGFDIHFDNFISQNQSDLNQILLIENVSEAGLKDDIDKVKELTKDIEDESTKKVINDIVTFENGLEVFKF